MNPTTLDRMAVLVTGGESGIGRAIAIQCAARGARIAIVGLDMDLAATTATEIEAAGGVAIAARADVREPAQIDSALARTVDAFGSVDAVIANAGIMQPPLPFVDLPLEKWQAVISVNLTGAFLTLQAGARLLIAQGRGGSLLATGSSTVSRPHGAKAIAYVAAKGAVHTMIRGLAFELAAHRIRVNAIAPGLTETPLTRAIPGYIEEGLRLVPWGEVVEPEEIGALAAFILSDQARHMTGSIVSLDAGRTTD